MRIKPVNIFLMVSLAGIFVWSMISPYDWFTWVLEVAPAVVGAAVVLIAFLKGFKFTQLVYVLMWLHAIVLIVGGKYSYALNPGFEWLKEVLDLERNYYDRLGHFMQGFVPAMIAREVLLRLKVVVRRGWLFFIVVCICLAVSALYELIEWWVAMGTGESAESFLGTQGDVWDAQWDMCLALTGAILAQLIFGWIHDRALGISRAREVGPHGQKGE
jgi:putative membrane protein